MTKQRERLQRMIDNARRWQDWHNQRAVDCGGDGEELIMLAHMDALDLWDARVQELERILATMPAT